MYAIKNSKFFSLKKFFNNGKSLIKNNLIQKYNRCLFTNKSDKSGETTERCSDNYVSTLVRRQAPNFKGTAWWNDDFKTVSLESFKGKWVCLFFYPLDFTFVCPTEIVDFSARADEFAKLSK